MAKRMAIESSIGETATDGGLKDLGYEVEPYYVAHRDANGKMMETHCGFWAKRNDEYAGIQATWYARPIGMPFLTEEQALACCRADAGEQRRGPEKYPVSDRALVVPMATVPTTPPRVHLELRLSESESAALWSLYHGLRQCEATYPPRANVSNGHDRGMPVASLPDTFRWLLAQLNQTA
jgi:hypothetical protein